MPTAQWPEWTDRFTASKNITYYDRPARIVVEAGLHYLQGNSSPYFAVTAEIYAQGDRRGDPSTCGCCHDEVLKTWPELAPVVALHLADIDGAPMHAEANGLYHLGFGPYGTRNDKIAAEHFRIPEEDVPTLIARIHAVVAENGWYPSEYAKYIAECRPRWKAEADAARVLLQSLIAATVAV